MNLYERLILAADDSVAISLHPDEARTLTATYLIAESVTELVQHDLQLLNRLLYVLKHRFGHELDVDMLLTGAYGGRSQEDG